MNILFLTQILPYPPDAGPKVKTFHVLRALREQGHAVTLASFVRPEETQHVLSLGPLCETIHTIPIHRSRLRDVGYMLRSFRSGLPFLVERDDLRPMQNLVDRLVCDGNIDFIHADQVTMAQFAIRAKFASPDQKAKVIFDAHNAVWTIVDRMQKNAHWVLKPILGLEMKRLKRYEGELLKSVKHVLAVTDVDKASLEEAFRFTKPKMNESPAPVTIVPIAVDTRQLQPVRRLPASKNIVTLGTLHYPPNADGIRWFINEVFPLIHRRNPDATLTIIGRNPPQDFLQAQTRYPQAIRITGYAPELIPYLEKSALMVVPVRAGGGMRVRILEAFAYAMPLVTTTVGLEGINAMPDRDVLVADSAPRFAACVNELLENIPLQETLATHGRELAESMYDWRVVLSAMKPIYEC